ncbi:hypothetical protein BDV26DRAFT_287130 [Aspergillus bertholletiae]|uniref:Rhodopsin domain-containing protein n=1 Tax=Aspergillus bertholletiae TaxID=1226010 RepID=A0A5N7BQ27_9EURO|nr:hypothetical protein BDV26DRAFT_287130 [Aspergillus bertholletiae]
MSRNSIEEVTFMTVLWVSITVNFFFITIRLLLQYRIDRQWHTSDALILAAWVLSLGNGITWSTVYKDMYLVVPLATSTGTDPTKLPNNMASMQRRYLNGQLAAYLLSFTGLWLVKLSFVFFFRKLGNRYRAQRILWWVVLVLVLLCYGGTIGTLDYKCEMSSMEYSLGQLARVFHLRERNLLFMIFTEHCANIDAMRMQKLRLKIGTAMDIISDGAIIILSGNVMWRARVNLWRKLALIGVSCLTAFIIVIALLRLFLSVWGLRIIDPIWLAFWNALEICVAIVVACLASFWTFYTKSKRPSSDSYQRNLSSPNRTYASLEAPILLASHMSERDKNAPSALSIQSVSSRQGADPCHATQV